MPTLLRGLLTATIAVALTLGALPSAHADDSGEDAVVSWSVRPATTAGADGRSWAELEMDAGESAVEYLEVKNFSDEQVTFTLHAADGYFTDTGRFNMLPADQRSTDAGLWVDVPETVTVDAGQAATVPYTISIPSDAAPGDHPAGVAASVSARGSDTSGNAVNVESRVGFRVMIRVAGDLLAQATAQIEPVYTMSWNPLQPGHLVIGYAVTNAGNTRLRVDPAITAQSMFGLITRAVDAEPVNEIAPGETRHGTVTMNGIWPLGPLDVSLEGATTPTIDTGKPAETVEVSATVLAAPYAQLATLALGTLLVVALLRDRRRRRDRVEEQLESAREQGRQEVLRRDDQVYSARTDPDRSV